MPDTVVQIERGEHWFVLYVPSFFERCEDCSSQYQQVPDQVAESGALRGCTQLPTLASQHSIASLKKLNKVQSSGFDWCP